MPTGAITEYIDVAQIALYLFWFFFAGLILYLRREDKREGYPLESDRSRDVQVEGFPALPKPKVFALAHGGEYEAPHPEPSQRPIAAEPAAAWPGAPLEPTGDPMLDGVGPASWAERSNHPELTVDGDPRIVPMRVATEFRVAEQDPDPRGMAVLGADGEPGGTVCDLWVDRSEPQIRYLEVEVEGAEPRRRVLLPMTLSRIVGSARQVRVKSVMGRHFATVPGTASPDLVTQREEDRICAYYGGGHLYAAPERSESLV